MNTAPISASQTSARMAVRLRPPALFSDAPSLIAAPSSIATRHVRAGLLAHEIGEPARHFAFVGLRKGAKQHVGHDQAEHMVAEKFEPLIAAGAVARSGERGNVGERLLEQRGVLEAVADALLEARRAAAPTLCALAPLALWASVPGPWFPASLGSWRGVPGLLGLLRLWQRATRDFGSACSAAGMPVLALGFRLIAAS